MTRMAKIGNTSEAKSVKERRIVPKDIRESADQNQLQLLPRDQALIAKLNQWYDRRMFEHKAGDLSGDFSNFGYWERHTRTYREACENLMEQLLSFIPEKKGVI